MKEMTLFQARFVQWLTLTGCSLRATAGYYYGRYNDNNEYKGIINDYDGYGANQLDGIRLRELAIKTLLEHNIVPIISVYDNNIGYDDNDYFIWHTKYKQDEKRR